MMNGLRGFLLLCLGFVSYLNLQPVYGDACSEMGGYDNVLTVFESENADQGCAPWSKRIPTLTYYLNISDFINSFIEIPTSNVSVDSSTTGSSYYAGRAPLYDEQNRKVGICSASFLNMQNADGVFTDISNYISVDNGLIVTWFTPTRPLNLEVDSIVRSMVTKCIVLASTKIGFNPFFGKTFTLVVSSDDQKIYFKFTQRP